MQRMSEDKNPLLSVIVPIYNAGQYLEKCLASIRNQTFQDMEIILVNDGSTDNSLEISRNARRLDKRIRIISQENGGLIRARKTGLSAASGRFIGFVDSDDRIEPTMYEVLVNCMERTGCDLVSSGMIRDYENPNRQAVIYDNYPEGIYREPEKSVYPTMLYHSAYRTFGIYCNLVNKLFKRELLEQVYEDISDEVFYGEDALTCYPYCLKANSIYILHQAFYHYNIHPVSMASAPDKRLPYNTYLLYRGLYESFSKSSCAFALIRQLKKYLLSLERHNLLALYQFDVVALDEWRFSFRRDLYDSRFVLYGAGACGQAHYRRLCEMGKEQNMVLWVDKEAEKRTRECAYPISRPWKLTQTDWDVLLVSVQSGELGSKIMDELYETYHIEREKMLWSSVEHIPIWDIY